MIRLPRMAFVLLLILSALAGCRAMGSHSTGGHCAACDGAARYDTP